MPCSHSQVEIAAEVLKRDGVIRAYNAVYSLTCPVDGSTRRNTRLAASIHTLRHEWGLAIDTRIPGPGMLAEYRLAETAKPWTVEAVPVVDRWECDSCGAKVDMKSNPGLQPALGGYKQGRCPNHKCSTNGLALKHRKTIFKPITQRR